MLVSLGREHADDLPLTTRFTLGPAHHARAARLPRRARLPPLRAASRRRTRWRCWASEMERIEARVARRGPHARLRHPALLRARRRRAGRSSSASPSPRCSPRRSAPSCATRASRPILELIGDDARVGDREKDGVVVNRYLNVPGSVYPRLGWHTDGLRDLFYGRMPQQMLNIGLHLDRCTRDNGGLRLIPGSHRQGFWSMCFRKPYFVSHRRRPGRGAASRPSPATSPCTTAASGTASRARRTRGARQPAPLDVPALPHRPVRAEERRQPDAGVPPARRMAARPAR